MTSAPYSADDTVHSAPFTIGMVRSKLGQVHDRREVDWHGLCDLVSSHTVRAEKDGPGWLPADIAVGPRTKERATCWAVLALDIEGKAARDPETGAKRLIGPAAPPLREVAAELELWSRAACLVTSHSHYEPCECGSLGPRYRVVLLPSRPIAASEIEPLADHVAALLGLSDVLDRTGDDLNRFFYLPTCPAERQHLAEAVTVEGMPFDVDRVLRQARAANTPPPSRPGTQGPSVIVAFNQAYDVAVILEEHGYKPKGRNRWVWPGSTTGEPGVVLLPESGRVFSHHPNDPLHGDHAHDAFSAFCCLEHGNDYRSAVKAAAALLGMDHVSGVSGAGSQGFSKKTWPEPTEIKTDLPPAPTFEVEALLPPQLAAFVLDEADRMPCPPDYVAAALVVALGSVIGARCALKPKRRDDWIVAPNLFGGVVGDPASKKTPAIGTVMRFLDRLEAKEAKNLAEATKVYEAEMAAHEARQASLKTAMKKAAGSNSGASKMDSAVSDLLELEPPQEPHKRRFKSNDATVEKLGDLLTRNPDGMLVFRDELVGLLFSWDKDGHEGDRAFYLEGWNGTGSFNIDRVVRGSLYVPNLCLSVFGGIQPDLLSKYLAGISSSLDNDGRIQRFQVLVYPEEVAWQWRDRYPAKGAREAVRDLFDRLAMFDPEQDGAAAPDDFVKLPHFHFDNQAQEVFIEWSGELHREHIAKEQDALMRQHLGKFEKLFCSLALILHLAEGSIGPVTSRSAVRAAAWCQYLAGHARRIYGLVDAAKVTTASMIGRRLIERKLEDGFTARDVWKKGWAGIASTVQAEAALAILERHGWVTATEGKDDQPGRPTTRYYINPRIWGQS